MNWFAKVVLMILEVCAGCSSRSRDAGLKGLWVDPPPVPLWKWRKRRKLTLQEKRSRMLADDERSLKVS